MLIKEKSLDHWINHFYGYGSWDARIWFVGYEEGGGEVPEEVIEKFDYFDQNHANTILPTLCDIREVYKRVTFRGEGPRATQFKTFHEYRFGHEAILHGIWKNLIAFVHGYRDENLPDLLSYQKEKFAASAAREALIQLYPLPSSHNHAWYYSWVDLPTQYGFLKSRARYEEHIFKQRIDSILSNMQKYHPDLVVMYGMNNINALKSAVQEYFPDAKFSMVKGTKLETPQHHRADFNGMTMLITTQIPALKHNRAETGFDWQDFGRKVRTY